MNFSLGVGIHFIKYLEYKYSTQIQCTLYIKCSHICKMEQVIATPSSFPVSSYKVCWCHQDQLRIYFKYGLL